jgi:hypothetical protein
LYNFIFLNNAKTHFLIFFDSVNLMSRHSKMKKKTTIFICIT